MTLHGTQGYDTASLRQEVARGARFVLYPFCVSVVVMTFKRSSGIYFVKAGESRLVKGLPFALLTLVAGWWGFPWGPIYSIQSLVNTLMGGVDVTNEVLATLPGASESQTVVPGAEPSPNPSTGRKAFVGVAIVGSLAAAVVLGICLYKKTHLPVYLLSGNLQPYEVQVGGHSYVLKNGHPVQIECSEGDIEVIGDGRSPTAVHHFELSAPFFEHLFASKVAVINPDGIGIFFEDKRGYYVGTPPSKDPETEGFTLFANQGSWLLEARDFQFCDYPRTASVPSGMTRAIKTRLTTLPDLALDDRGRIVQMKFGVAGLQTYLERAAASGEQDDLVVMAAWTLLKDSDFMAFLAKGRAEKPVRVEWHRFYQNYMAKVHPDVDVRSEYEKLWAEHPDDGDYAYLLTRVIDDLPRARTLARQSLEAKRPCAYGHVAVAYYALSDGDYALAREECGKAKAAGLRSETSAINLREAELGLRDFQAAIKDETGDLAQPEGEKETSNIAMLLMSGAPRTQAERIARGYLARKKAEHAFDSESEFKQAQAYFDATIAYGCGDEAAFAEDLASFGTDRLHEQAAIAARDAVKAASLLKQEKSSDPDAWFLCYVVAMETGRLELADDCFRQATTCLAGPQYHHERLAALLSGGDQPEAEDLLQADFFPTEKRTFLTAMAYRYPALRDALAKKAAELNVNPAFPYQTIRRITAAFASES